MSNLLDSGAFAAAHPDIAKKYEDEGLDWLNLYSKTDGDKLIEMWRRDKNGVLVDVTAVEIARREVIAAQEQLEHAHTLNYLDGVKSNGTAKRTGC